ncbi:fasciclin domain-containing protein [Streptomyces sp. NPDC091377]|uniref:fasciclin domain-containing protein n=1 Tax=Streptomyces sp. NPDC091377 TaxID=3365995 RepID=UPI00381327AC
MKFGRSRTLVGSVAVALPLALAVGAAPQAFAAASPSPSGSASAGTSTSPSASASTSASPSASTSTSASPSASASAKAGTFGTGCNVLPTSGNGSTADSATEKTGDAIADTKELSQLNTLLKKANLTKTLNDAKQVTVFAPTNAAFKKLSQTELDNLMNNADQLKKVLQYHVVEKNITRSNLAKGSFTTLEGAKLTTAGSGSTFKVNNVAKITCGDIKTKNGQIDLVDTVLMPPS